MVRRLESGPAGTLTVDFSSVNPSPAVSTAPGGFQPMLSSDSKNGRSSSGSGSGSMGESENGSSSTSGGGGIATVMHGLASVAGEWRLVYSSAFASGSLGGLRPGPPNGRLPLQLGKVRREGERGNEREMGQV